MRFQILRIIGAICVFLVVLEISFILTFFSEACDDALKYGSPMQSVPLAKVLLAVAPFGLFPIITPIVAAVLYWRITANSTPRIHELVFPISLALFGLIAMALSAEYTRQFLYMDGGKSGSTTAWLFNGTIIAGMLWAIQRSWKMKNTEQTETKE